MKRKPPFKMGVPLAPLVLPAVYDDVLSYEEWLSKVIYRLNELTDFINETIANIEQLVDERITVNLDKIKKDYQKQIDELKAQIADLIERLDNTDEELSKLGEKVDRNYNSLLAYVDEKVLEIKANFNKTVYDFFLQAKIYTDNKVNRESIYRRADIKGINDRLQAYVREWPLVYCPPLGIYTDVERAIVEVWDSLRMFALTASEYDAFEFTAQEYTDLLLTAFEYDVYAAYILRDSIKQMFNPFTGKHENIRDVVNYIANMLKWNGKTAAEYDSYEFTAQEFDNSDYTAYPQDSSKYWTSPDIDKKNKFYKSFLKVYEREAATTSQAEFSFTFDATGYQGLSVVIAPDSSEASERIDLDGVGTFAISNNAGVRTFTIAQSGSTITVTVSDNVSDDTTDPITTTNTANLINQVFRRGSAYDVTQLDA